MGDTNKLAVIRALLEAEEGNQKLYELQASSCEDIDRRQLLRLTADKYEHAASSLRNVLRILERDV